MLDLLFANKYSPEKINPIGFAIKVNTTDESMTRMMKLELQIDLGIRI
jgi:hypothetical protein